MRERRREQKGNGGPNDETSRCDPTGDPKAVICIAQARAKCQDQAATWPFGAAVLDLVESTIDALFNVAPSCF